MSKTRILFITHAYYNKGGVEEHIRDLAQGLNASFDTYILTPVQKGRDQHIQLLKNGVIQQIFPGNYIDWPLAPFRENLACYALEKAIDVVKPQLIHIHHLQNWPLEILYHICKSNIPTILTAHDYFLATPLFTMEFSHHPRELLTKEYSERVFGTDISDYLKMRREIITNSINKLTCLITPSNNAKDEISKIIPAEYKVIPHGIRTFQTRKKISEANKVRFGYIGSLIRQKGWKTLLEAFKLIKKKYPDTELNVFGGGYDTEKVKLNSNIKYHGNFSKKDLGNILSTFDIGIIPSIFKETFCYTLAEMQCAGLPVIASNIGAISDRINDENGLLFEPGDINDLFNKMEWFIENRKKHSWHIQRPKTLNEMCQDYSNIYQTVSR